MSIQNHFEIELLIMCENQSELYLPLYILASWSMSLLMRQGLSPSVLHSSATWEKACLKPTAQDTQRFPVTWHTTVHMQLCTTAIRNQPKLTNYILRRYTKYVYQRYTKNVKLWVYFNLSGHDGSTWVTDDLLEPGAEAQSKCLMSHHCRVKDLHT